MTHSKRAMKHWRVTFRRDGTVRAVVALKGPGHDRWVVVQAATEAEAQRKARNLYAARLKRQRAIELKAAGKCSCGRQLDGTLVEVGKHKGKPRSVCAFCRDRMKRIWRPRHSERVEAGTVGTGRDEASRIALNNERRHERRAEARLEVLREVREVWQKTVTVGRFTKWLEAEISALKGVAA